MSEASEFDRVMQSMSDGTYQATSSAMETFPVRPFVSLALIIMSKIIMSKIHKSSEPYISFNISCVGCIFSTPFSGLN